MLVTGDLYLLTESRYEAPKKIDWYIEQILTEDRLVQEALERAGWRVQRVDWSRSDIDWSAARAGIFRTTWDYFHQYPAFQSWLDRVSMQLPLFNTAELARWNMDKHYLRDLAKAGINIPPTVFIEAGDRRSLRAWHTETGWTETVLKPAVSGAGRHTYRLDPGNWSAYEDLYQSLIAQEAMLLQVFQTDVVETGELALMVIDGQVTHAVKKVAKPGEFRVQDDFGGTVHPHEPTAAEIQFAERAVAACPEPPVYARVDLFRDNDGQLALAELELIEPEMWFRHHPPAAEALARAISRRLNAPA